MNQNPPVETPVAPRAPSAPLTFDQILRGVRPYVRPSQTYQAFAETDHTPSPAAKRQKTAQL